jgi:outer membrane receptor protein involved in Fe transport
MKLITTASLALALLGGAASLAAQNPAQPPAAGPGEIRGTVVDAQRNVPVGSASITVRSRADSAIVAGAIARPDGSFRIEGLRPGAYYLRVSMMGYTAQTSATLTIAPASPVANVGPIRLAPSAVALQGLTATGERQAVAIAPDRNTYSTRTVAPAATNASEVLEAVPSVEVDPDGKVSLRGNENVVIQINGRPSPMKGTQLAGYLKQLPANTLERVEVIPNPSARQDPEGMAGIINIVLKQNVDLGLSGGATLSASTSERYNVSGNLGWQQGRATLFASYGFISDSRVMRGINDRTRLGALGAPLSFTNQELSGSAGADGHNFNGSIDYRLTPKNVLSTALLLNDRGAGDESLSEYSELDATEALRERYQRIREVESNDRMVDYTLAFKRTMVPQRHELSSEVRVNRVRGIDDTNLWRQSVAGDARADLEINRDDALIWQVTAQTDYTRPVGTGGKLETGYRGYARWQNRDYTVRVDPLGIGTFVDSDLSNALELDERVNAVYGVFSRSVGRFELQGGLRGEHAWRDFTLSSTGEHFPKSYWSLFPSGLASLKVGQNDQVKLSYSRRIRRPGGQELNPFPVFFDLQNVFLGNPGLDPEYTDALELSWQHSARIGSLQVSPFYRRTSNVIRFIIDTDAVVAGREVTSITFQNLDHGTSWGADVNGSLRFGQKFSGFAGFNLYKLVTEGGGESTLASNAVSWSARANGTWNLTPRTAFTAQYMYRAATPLERGRFAANSNANLSVRQKLYGEKASLTLRVSDPFATNRFRVEAGDDNVIQLTERSFNSRALHATFQYTFGRPPRLRQPAQEPQPPQTGTSFPG